MSWLDPPPLVKKPLAPGLRLPASARKGRVAVIVVGAACVMGIVVGVVAFAGSTVGGLFFEPLLRLRLLITISSIVLGALYGSVIGWGIIAAAAASVSSKTHDAV